MGFSCKWLLRSCRLVKKLLENDTRYLGYSHSASHKLVMGNGFEYLLVPI